MVVESRWSRPCRMPVETNKVPSTLHSPSSLLKSSSGALMSSHSHAVLISWTEEYQVIGSGPSRARRTFRVLCLKAGHTFLPNTRAASLTVRVKIPGTSMEFTRGMSPCLDSRP